MEEGSPWREKLPPSQGSTAVESRSPRRTARRFRPAGDACGGWREPSLGRQKVAAGRVKFPTRQGSWGRSRGRFRRGREGPQRAAEASIRPENLTQGKRKPPSSQRSWERAERSWRGAREASSGRAEDSAGPEKLPVGGGKLPLAIEKLPEAAGEKTGGVRSARPPARPTGQVRWRGPERAFSGHGTAGGRTRPASRSGCRTAA